MTVRELHPDPYEIADYLEQRARARRRPSPWPAEAGNRPRRPRRRRGLTPHPDPAYLRFLEAYTFAQFVADGRIGPRAAHALTERKP